MPAKDTGLDLLVTDSKCKRTVSLQVKFSKDFNVTHRSALFQNKLRASGWWTHQAQKIGKSAADFWVLVLPSSIDPREISFIIIPPTELLRRFHAIFGRPNHRTDSYLWVTKTHRCWEARGLRKEDQDRIAFDKPPEEGPGERDFSEYLNAWHQIERRLK